MTAARAMEYGRKKEHHIELRISKNKDHFLNNTNTNIIENIIEIR